MSITNKIMTCKEPIRAILNSYKILLKQSKNNKEKDTNKLNRNSKLLEKK